MSDARMDLERLGALLDRRVARDERAELLARLGASAEDRAVFADTAEVLRALEEEDAAARPARRVPRWTWGALAAGIVLALVLPAVLRRSPGALPAPEETALALASRDEALPPGWLDPWPPSRSEGQAAAVRAARTGVKHFRLLLAFSAGDTARRADAAGDMQELVAGSGPLSAAYAELASPTATAADLAETGALAARLLGEEPFRLGAWVEAARLAVEHRDERFFNAGTTAAVLERAAGLRTLSGPAATALENLRRELKKRDPPDWVAREEKTEALALALTR